MFSIESTLTSKGVGEPLTTWQSPRRTRALTVSLLTLLLCLGLWWAYESVISPSFSYFLYTYNAPPFLTTFAAIGMVIGIGLLMPRSIERPSAVIYWIIFVIVVIPVSVIPELLLGGILSSTTSRQLLLDQLILNACFVGIGLLLRLPPPRVQLFRMPARTFWPIVFSIMFILYVILLGATGLHQVPSLSEIYTTRAAYKSSLAGSSGAAYASTWLANVFNPLLITCGVASRRIYMIAMGVAGQLLIYSVSGEKAALFSTGLLLVVSYILSPKRRFAFGRNILFGTGCVVFVSLAVDRLLGGQMWTSIFSRRFLVTPSFLTGVYFDFFSHNPHAHLGTGILSGIVSSPYTQDPASVIGHYLYPQGTDNANVNLFGDAFANFGHWGMLIFSLLFAAFLLLIDGASRERDVRFTSMFLVMIALSWTQSALFTTLLTGGALLALIILFVLPSESDLGLDAAWSSPSSVEGALSKPSSVGLFRSN